MYDEPVLVTILLTTLGTLVAFEIYNTLIGHLLLEWLKPLAMAAVAYAVLWIPWTPVRYALAVAGAVAVVRAVIAYLTAKADQPIVYQHRR